MDIKVKTSQRRKGRRSNQRARIPLMGLSGGQNMTITCRYDYGEVKSGTAGSISIADISPTIQNMSEYSTIASLFSEIKLLACTIVFTNTCTSASVNGRVIIGTQLQANYNSHATPPLVSTQVENLAAVKYLSIGYSIFDAPFRYKMVVPQGLEYASISADAPATVTPWAGSPGCVYVFGDGLSASFQYFRVDVIATYAFRGRV